MKYIRMLLIPLVLASVLGSVMYYQLRFDGLSPKHAVTRVSNRDIVAQQETALGTVILSNSQKPDGDAVVDPFHFGYTVVARRVIPWFWYRKSGGACTVDSIKTVLTTLYYDAHRYNAEPLTDTRATDGSVVCGAVTSPAVQRVAVTFSDTTRLEAPVQNTAFIVAYDEVAKACTIEALDSAGQVLETSKVLYVVDQSNWQHTQPCDE